MRPRLPPRATGPRYPAAALRLLAPLRDLFGWHALDAVGDSGHELGRQSHCAFDRRGQFRRAQTTRGTAMLRLVGAHGGDNGPRALIPARQRLEVTRQMLLHLALGLREESEVPAIAQGPR